jgi:hypothetical protein
MPLFSGQSLGGQWRKWILGAVKDLFNRANTASSLGSADTGQPWTNLRGTWFINNNKANSSSPASYPLASVQAGLMTPYLKADVDTLGGAGLAFWVTDIQNWYGVFGQTNTNTSYSQTCATYSQTGPTYYCGGTYSQTGPFYSCSGSINTSYYQYCTNPSGASYGSSCVNPVGPNYSPYCSVQSAPTWSISCTSSSGPTYTSICGTSVGPTYGSGCAGWSTAYDGFRGYWYAKCTGGYFAVGPYYSCTSWYSSAPTWSCSAWTSSGPNYTCTTYASSGPSYYCGGTYSQTGPFYSCGGSYAQGTSYSCSGTVLGPNYGSSCSNTVGPNYASACASYTQSSATSAGTTSLRIIKSAANVVTTVVDQVIAQLPASIQVFFNGNQVVARAYSGAGQTSQIGSDITYTDASPVKSTVHGIILAPGGYYQGTTVDNFSANTVQ